MGQLYSFKEIYNKIKNCRDGSYILDEVEDPLRPIKSRTKIQIKHDCGNVFISYYQNFLHDNGSRCKICYPNEKSPSPRKIRSKEDIQSELDSKFGKGEVKILGDYVKSTVRTLIRHKCGNEYLYDIKTLLRKGRHTTGCKVCASKNRGAYSQKEDYLESILAKGYRWLEPYKGNNKIPHKIRHKCGNEYLVSPNTFQQGYRCIKCNPTPIPIKSRNTLRIENFLKDYEIPFIQEYVDLSFKSKKGGQFRFDFAIEYDDKFIIIEYDGEFHSRNEKELNSRISNLSEYSVFRKNLIRTFKRDREKDLLISNNPDKYIAIHRITYKDPLIKTLKSILSLYYDFEN